MNVVRNRLLMLLKPLEMYFSCLVAIAFIQGMFCVTTKLYHKHLQLQLCFTGTIVEEFPTGLPRFTKHCKDAANKNLRLPLFQ